MDDPALRNFKDFLLLYNKLTERCFTRCVDTIQTRGLELNEQECIDNCSLKFIKYNNKLMTNFVRAQGEIMGKRSKALEEEQRLLEQKNAEQVQNEINQQNSIEAAA